MIHEITCPICHKPANDPGTTPFCSNRCRKIDFFRWWDGRYAIASPVDPASDPKGTETLHDWMGKSNPPDETP